MTEILQTNQFDMPMGQMEVPGLSGIQHVKNKFRKLKQKQAANAAAQAQTDAAQEHEDAIRGVKNDLVGMLEEHKKATLNQDLRNAEDAHDRLVQSGNESRQMRENTRLSQAYAPAPKPVAASHPYSRTPNPDYQAAAEARMQRGAEMAASRRAAGAATGNAIREQIRSNQQSGITQPTTVSIRQFGE